MAEGELAHYGILRRSGRYPWGSGETPMERSSRGFLAYVDDLKRQGLSDPEIAKGLGLESTTQLRATKSIARNEVRKADAAMALRLKDKNMSNVAIAKQMKINESSVRALLNPAMQDRRDILETTANMLKEHMGDGYLDIGAGTENHLGISATKLSTAVARLKEEGYEVRNIQQPQQFGAGKTTIKTLVPPGAPKFIDPTKIKTVAAISDDGGRSYTDIHPPVNVDLKRVAVRYAEQGGTNADGVIFLRRGVDDISLGGKNYAQVRIAVGGTHYLKGMAMYKDDLPEGVDLLFNTNKKKSEIGDNPLDAMKPQKTDDPINPFGAQTTPRFYVDSKGNKKQSALNVVNEEGNWQDWSRTLSSQFLSKQSTNLAQKQLDLALKGRQEEYNTIQSLTNPVVKKKLLETFADGADSASVHLKAAALPGQGTHVILPVESMKEGEIYAPKYQNGQRVALVRFPHGGTFEIPELVVNNKNPEAQKSITPGARDAVGIHPKVAERLSGADFDGDTVLVIPNNNGVVKSSAPLSGLKDFDPKAMYPAYPGMKPMTGKAKQQQMGDVSNLITDMTIKGANARPDELAAAVRHSMVVIDAEKHNLNYKQSYIDNGIASLKEKYQGRGPTGKLSGASTIVSRAGSEKRIPERKLRSAAQGGPIDTTTGKKVYVETGAAYTNKAGKTVIKTTKVERLAVTDDAHELSSGTPIEEIYANHSNSLKSLANQARLASLNTGGQNYSPTANKTYSAQVASLNAKLNEALKNKPLERQAQIIANSMVSAQTRDNPGMDNADLKKIKGRALETARARVGASKTQVEITPDEWQAIQAGAITTNKLNNILDNADLDKVKALAMPRTATVMTPAKVAQATQMLNSGYTQAEIASHLGVPVSTLNSALLSDGGSGG